MEQYIPKSALLAEIERRKDEEVDYDEGSKNFASYADQIHYFALDSIEDFINTLEVKEVDLDKVIEEYFNGWTDNYDNGGASPDVDDCKAIAKHFFELGLKAQKGE